MTTTFTKDLTLPLRLWDWTYLAGELLTSLEHAIDHNDFMFFMTTINSLTNLTSEEAEKSGVIPPELWEPVRRLCDLPMPSNGSPLEDKMWQMKARAFIEEYNRAWLKWRDHELGRDARGIVPA